MGCVEGNDTSRGALKLKRGSSKSGGDANFGGSVNGGQGRSTQEKGGGAEAGVTLGGKRVPRCSIK